MEQEQGSLVSPSVEVLVVEGEVVSAIRRLAECGWGTKAIARELAVARNTVRRYVRAAVPIGVKVRPTARRLSETGVAAAQTLFGGEAAGNAVVVQRLLAAQGQSASVRTVQRAVAPVRQAQRAAMSPRSVWKPRWAPRCKSTSARSASGSPVAVTVFLLAAVLSYSRRLFVKAFLAERQDEWREGIAAAFLPFGGVPRNLLGDNARALVIDRDRLTGTVWFHPAYLALCRDWDTQPRACAP
jgi:transposase